MATSMTVNITQPLGATAGLGALLGGGPTFTASFNFLVDNEAEAEEYGREAHRYFIAFCNGMTAAAED